MQIQINGQPETVDGPLTVADLLERFALAAPRVAVEVNERLVRRSEFARTALQNNDRVEIVTLVGGG